MTSGGWFKTESLAAPRPLCGDDCFFILLGSSGLRVKEELLAARAAEKRLLKREPELLKRDQELFQGENARMRSDLELKLLREESARLRAEQENARLRAEQENARLRAEASSLLRWAEQEVLAEVQQEQELLRKQNVSTGTMNNPLVSTGTNVPSTEKGEWDGELLRRISSLLGWPEQEVLWLRSVAFWCFIEKREKRRLQIAFRDWQILVGQLLEYSAEMKEAGPTVRRTAEERLRRANNLRLRVDKAELVVDEARWRVEMVKWWQNAARNARLRVEGIGSGAAGTRPGQQDEVTEPPPGGARRKGARRVSFLLGSSRLTVKGEQELLAAENEEQDQELLAAEKWRHELSKTEQELLKREQELLKRELKLLATENPNLRLREQIARVQAPEAASRAKKGEQELLATEKKEQELLKREQELLKREKELQAAEDSRLRADGSSLLGWSEEEVLAAVQREQELLRGQNIAKEWEQELLPEEIAIAADKWEQEEELILRQTEQIKNRNKQIIARIKDGTRGPQQAPLQPVVEVVQQAPVVVVSGTNDPSTAASSGNVSGLTVKEELLTERARTERAGSERAKLLRAENATLREDNRPTMDRHNTDPPASVTAPSVGVATFIRQSTPPPNSGSIGVVYKYNVPQLEQSGSRTPPVVVPLALNTNAPISGSSTPRPLNTNTPYNTQPAAFVYTQDGATAVAGGAGSSSARGGGFGAESSSSSGFRESSSSTMMPVEARSSSGQQQTFVGADRPFLGTAMMGGAMGVSSSSQQSGATLPQQSNTTQQHRRTTVPLRGEFQAVGEKQDHRSVVTLREMVRRAREEEMDMKRREGQLRQCVVAFKEEMGRVAEEEWTEGQRLRWQFLEREIASLRAENAELLTKNAQDISDVVDIRKDEAAEAEVFRNARVLSKRTRSSLLRRSELENRLPGAPPARPRGGPLPQAALRHEAADYWREARFFLRGMDRGRSRGIALGRWIGPDVGPHGNMFVVGEEG